MKGKAGQARQGGGLGQLTQQKGGGAVDVGCGNRRRHGGTFPPSISSSYFSFSPGLGQERRLRTRWSLVGQDPGPSSSVRTRPWAQALLVSALLFSTTAGGRAVPYSGHTLWAEQALIAAKNTPPSPRLASPLPAELGSWSSGHESVLRRRAGQPGLSAGQVRGPKVCPNSVLRAGSLLEKTTRAHPLEPFAGGKEGEGRCALDSLGFGRKWNLRIFGPETLGYEKPSRRMGSFGRPAKRRRACREGTLPPRGSNCVFGDSYPVLQGGVEGANPRGHPVPRNPPPPFATRVPLVSPRVPPDRRGFTGPWLARGRLLNLRYGKP